VQIGELRIDGHIDTGSPGVPAGSGPRFGVRARPTEDGAIEAIYLVGNAGGWKAQEALWKLLVRSSAPYKPIPRIMDTAITICAES
jgi:hypothetical protein